MRVTTLGHNWFGYNHTTQRQLVTFIVSVIIVLLLLKIPIKMYDFSILQESTIEVELSKHIPVAKPKVVNPQPIKQVVINPVVENKPIIENVDTAVKKPIVVEPKVTTTAPENKSTVKVTKLPSSAVIFNSAYGKVHLYELDKDFQARTGDEGKFKFRKIEQPKWNTVTKLIDEEVDKPRVEMNFYSEGIVGSTERFFDKVSWKKTITTRYGTKIYCGGVGPLAICSWK